MLGLESRTVGDNHVILIKFGEREQRRDSLSLEAPLETASPQDIVPSKEWL